MDLIPFWPCFCKFQQQQKIMKESVESSPTFIEFEVTQYVLRVFPDAVGYIAFQNKYCRHHTNWRLTDGRLWKAIRKSESMWQQFLTEIVQWIVPTAFSFCLFSPLFNSTEYSKTPFCPHHTQTFMTDGRKNLKCKKHLHDSPLYPASSKFQVNYFPASVSTNVFKEFLWLHEVDITKYVI